MSSSNEEILTSSEDSSFSLDHGDQPKLICTQRSRSFIENDHINALKKLQISYNELESRYLKSVHELEYTFHQRCSYLFDQRSDIINGRYEPNGDECQLITENIDTTENQSGANDRLGIPSFWLQTLKQVPMIAEMIEEWDEPILQCLSDIKLQLKIEPTPGFMLEFHFNDKAKAYFTNDVLIKCYELQIDPDENSLFYQGTAIVHSVGCQINWVNTTNNVTRNSETNEVQSSFFNFFTSSLIADNWKLTTDFQIGHYIRENIIPKAALYYTGDIFDDEYDYSNDDDDNVEHQDSFIQEETGEGEHL